MKKITRKQARILEFIKDFIAKHGFPPTIKEISEKFKVSGPTIYDQIESLKKKGYLKQITKKARALALTEFTEGCRGIKPTREIPILGKVPAGRPLLAIENLEGSIRIDADLVPKGDLFALRVKGDSMIGAHICEGDLVLVKKQDYAENNDIVVARINDEATVKRFFREDDKIKLVAENSNVAPLILDHKQIGEQAQVAILGKVVGLIRKIR